ncbi:FG-GAP and VCBS repeat-containing protein [Streptomyces sp. NBC_00525]|uniref:FG-GAP and VCBS repeat-containing protein n=1 Tax=Streptomyces sp. NBC_00525 TaxID=2903660 RepID=UPI002E81CBBA|nr:FG-GAP and VCBS repeat-containing protein [Streptomyces sp. NBC_00525]WUC98107.1 FG-GAP and VCBS repeat-containing protein [Streptomyces sp. NBC_00525]
MGIRTTLAIAVCAATALSGGTAVAAPGGTSAGTAGGTAATTVHEDFNGDGYQDLAVAAPAATVAGHSSAGYVAVSYGSAKGLSAARTTVIDQNTPGVPGASGKNQRFGYRLAAEDLDHDGLTDLALVTRERFVGEGYAINGSVILLWGSTGGITGKGAVRIPVEPDYQIGDNLTAGDFDGDGATDLMMLNGDSGRQRDVLYGPFTRKGVPARERGIFMTDTDNDMSNTAAGDFNGDGIDDLCTFFAYQNHSEGGKLWLGTPKGLSTKSIPLPSAAATAVGDFNKDGRDDLATRVVPNGNTENLPTDSGTIKVYYGSASGLSTTRTKTITQNTAGVPGVSEKGDQFGARLSAGDVNGDGYADLAAGVPFEAIKTTRAAGAVVLLKGGAGGLSGTGSKSFHQASTGVPGVAEAGDHFGGSVRLLDTNKDGRADLIAGAPDEDLEAVADGGAVWWLRGVSSGLTATGSVAFNPVDLGAPVRKARFGLNLSNDNGPSIG